MNLAIGNALRTTTVFLSLLFVNLVNAESSASKQQEKLNHWQLTGHLEAGEAYVLSNDQLKTDDNNVSPSGLDRHGDSFPGQLQAVLVDITLANTTSKTELYLRTPIDADLAITVGAAKAFEKMGEWDLSYFVKLNDTAWKDPYVLGVAREETDVSNEGFSIKHGDFAYSFNRLDVEEDIIGQNMTRLQRDGYVHSFEFAPTIPISIEGVLKPKLIYSKDDMVGISERSHTTEVEMGYETIRQMFLFHADIGLGVSRYDSPHPLFEQKRDGISYSATVIVTLLDPLAFKGLFNRFVVDHSCVNSKIKFFESCTSIVGATVGYRF